MPRNSTMTTSGMNQPVLIHTDLDVGKAFQPYHADQVGSTTTLGDANLKTGSELSAPWVYAVLLAAQTAAAFILFWMVFPIFHSLVTHLGERQTLDVSEMGARRASVPQRPRRPSAFLRKPGWLLLR